MYRPVCTQYHHCRVIAATAAVGVARDADTDGSDIELQSDTYSVAAPAVACIVFRSFVCRLVTYSATYIL